MRLPGYFWKLLALLALLAGAGWIGSRQFSPKTDSGQADKRVTESQPPSSVTAAAAAEEKRSPPSQEKTKPTKKTPVIHTQPTDLERQILKTLYAPGKIRDLLYTAQREGGADSAFFTQFVGAAAFACDSGLKHAKLDPLAASDEVRRWAIAGLVEACDSFDYRQVFPSGIPSHTDYTPSEVFEKFGTQAGIEAALKVITERRDYASLTDAGRTLVLAEGFPPALQVSTHWMGTPEKIRAWSAATQIYQCNLANGCGPQSLLTLSFCAQVGCRPNSDYRAALQQTLPPGQYTAMLAYLNWIETLKRSG